MLGITENTKGDGAGHAVMILLLLGVFIFLVARSWSMYPSVFPDEYVHSRSARLIPLSEAEIPGYFYYIVYSITGWLGDHFLKAARVLNAAFFVAGSYMVYATALRVTKTHLAMVIGLVAALSPMNTYTTYFMPESMFYFVFWVMIYVLLWPERGVPFSRIQWILVGLIFGSLSLIKPHALFIYPAILFYALFVYGVRKTTLVKVLLLTIAAGTVKFLGGFCAAGWDGLSLFGSLYTDHARSVVADPDLIMNAMRSVSVNLFGNFFLVLTILSLGLVQLFHLNATKLPYEEKRIRVLVSSLLMILVPMVAVFSTSVALYDFNLDNRLYLRYYNYAFPLIYIMISARLCNHENLTININKAILGSIFFIFILVPVYYYSLNKFFYPFKLFLTDSPELYLLQVNPIVLFSITVVGLITIMTWMYQERAGLKLYLYLFLPAFVVGTTFNTIEALSSRYSPLPQDVIGLKFDELIPSEEHRQIAVIGSNVLQLNHVALYSKSGETKIKVIDHVSETDSLMNSLSSKWLVLLDPLDAPSRYQAVWIEDGMSIYMEKER